MVGKSTVMVAKPNDINVDSNKVTKISLRSKSENEGTLLSDSKKKIIPNLEFNLTEPGKESEAKEFAESDVTHRLCPFKDKITTRKLFRRNDERCKYCRRLVHQSSAGKTNVNTNRNISYGNSRSTTIRRPFDNTLDEVAWACGRLWCSVRRRKSHRVLSLHHQRKKVKIDEAFSTLREILPEAALRESSKDSEAAKVSTLRLATSYIQALSDLLKDTHLSDKYSKDDSQSTSPNPPDSPITNDKNCSGDIRDFITITKSEDNRSLVNKLAS